MLTSSESRKHGAIAHRSRSICTDGVCEHPCSEELCTALHSACAQPIMMFMRSED